MSLIVLCISIRIDFIQKHKVIVLITSPYSAHLEKTG